ncbi:MAG: Gfo/Idh/MocA family oxidoreductase [Burkholderiales bacterium]
MIRIALVGLGKMGLSHLAMVRPHPDVDLVAVCDTVGYVLDTLNKYTGVRTYTDYAKMLEQEQLDAVLISTPSKTHGSMVRAALERNLHVFCEKPFSLDPEDGLALAELAERRGLVTQVGYHYRFVGAFQEVKRLVAANAIGRIHHVLGEAYGPVVLRPKPSTWRTSKSEGGGCLYDYACHALDLMNYLVGPPTSVRGSVLNKIFSADVEDEVYASMYYGSGMTGQLAVNWSDESYRKMSTKITLWGTEGRIYADRQEVQIFLRGQARPELRLDQGWNIRYTTELTDEVWFYLRGEEYSAQIDHFVRHVQLRDPKTRCSFRDAVQADVVAGMIVRDAKGESGTSDQVGDRNAAGGSSWWRRVTGA